MHFFTFAGKLAETSIKSEDELDPHNLDAAEDIDVDAVSERDDSELETSKEDSSSLIVSPRRTPHLNSNNNSQNGCSKSPRHHQNQSPASPDTMGSNKDDDEEGGSTGSGGGAGSRPVKPAKLELRVRGNCQEMESIPCHLETKELWEKFYELGTEMIITKTGR